MVANHTLYQLTSCEIAVFLKGLQFKQMHKKDWNQYIIPYTNSLFCKQIVRAHNTYFARTVRLLFRPQRDVTRTSFQFVNKVKAAALVDEWTVLLPHAQICNFCFIAKIWLGLMYVKCRRRRKKRWSCKREMTKMNDDCEKVKQDSWALVTSKWVILGEKKWWIK